MTIATIWFLLLWQDTRAQPWIREMPNQVACETIGAELVKMSHGSYDKEYKCVEVKK